MSRLVARALFYPTLGYNVLMTRFSSRNWYNRVDDTVVIGALPLKGVAKKLIEKENIKAVLSMNESYELKLTHTSEQYASLGVDHLQLSTVDLLGTPTLAKLHKGVDFLLAHRAKGNNVYVHCKAGRTRSASVVLCYLIKVNGWDPDKAYSFLKECRPHVWVREKQMASVRAFHNDII